ncbi:hypothetical protein KAU11_02300 [Candidatus Babeliales bacterium]|nr:hypothetical protein [Candidatus Babeliales bacterium]
MEIKINYIKEMCDKILSEVVLQVGKKEFVVDVDLYWFVGSDDLKKVTCTPPNIIVGSLIDDLDSLDKVLIKKVPATAVDFERFGNVVKVLGSCLSSGNLIVYEDSFCDSPKIEICKLLNLCEMLYNKLEKAEISKITFDFNDYWTVKNKNVCDVNPPDLKVQNIKEDLNRLMCVLDDNSIWDVNDIGRLGNVIIVTYALTSWVPIISV